MEQKYAEAKSELSGIGINNYIVEYDDNLECITFDSKVKSNGFHVDREKFKFMVFILLFFITTLSVAGWLQDVKIDLQYIAYAFAIALIIAFLGTLRRGMKINIDFKQRLVTRNSSKLKFSDIKKIYVDEYRVRHTMITTRTLKLRTAQGKMDFLLFLFDGEQEETQEQLYGWCEKYLN